MSVRAKARAAESRVPSPPSTMTSEGSSLGMEGTIHAGLVEVRGRIGVEQCFVVVLLEPVDEFGQKWWRPLAFAASR